MGFSRSHNAELNALERGTSGADTPMSIQDFDVPLSIRDINAPMSIQVFVLPMFTRDNDIKYQFRTTKTKHQNLGGSSFLKILINLYQSSLGALFRTVVCSDNMEIRRYS